MQDFTNYSLADLNFLNRLKEEVSDLENYSRERSTLVHKFNTEVKRKMNHQGWIYSGVFPLIIVMFVIYAYFHLNLPLASKHFLIEIFFPRTVALIFLLSVSFLIFFASYRQLWKKGKLKWLRRNLQKKVYQSMKIDEDSLNKKIELTVNQKEIALSRVPLEFLSSLMLTFLSRYLEFGYADTLEEAVYLLEKGIKQGQIAESYDYNLQEKSIVKIKSNMVSSNFLKELII